MGQTDTTTTPGFWQQLVNPIGSDISTLTSQLDTLNQQTAALTDATGTTNLGTWILVGLSGFGIWALVKSMRGAGQGIGKRIRQRRSKAQKRAQEDFDRKYAATL